MTLKDVSEFESITGYGIKAVVEGKEVLVGTRRLMTKFSIDIEPVLDRMEDS